MMSLDTVLLIYFTVNQFNFLPLRFFSGEKKVSHEYKDNNVTDELYVFLKVSQN